MLDDERSLAQVLADEWGNDQLKADYNFATTQGYTHLASILEEAWKIQVDRATIPEYKVHEDGWF